MNTTRFVVLVAVVLLAGCATQTQKPAELLLPQGPQSPARFEAVLQPQVDEQGLVSAIAVDSMVYGGLNEGTERLVLRAPVVYYGAYGIADRMSEIAVTDSAGSVELACSPK